MAISPLRDASRKAKKLVSNTELQYGLNSSRNWLFYSNNNGKSTLALTQLEGVDDPILCVSAGGASMYLSDEYPNAVMRSIGNLEEAEKLIKELVENAKLIQGISQILDQPDILEAAKQQFLKKYNGHEEDGIEDFKYLEGLAREGKFIFSRIVLEEIDIQSFWIQQKIEQIFDLDQIGEDKTKRGIDWNELQKEIIDYYSKWLRLPCETILCSPDKLPTERQGLTQIIPSICTGSAHRMLISLIGNVLYIDNKDGKFYVQLKQTKDVLIRAKFFPMKTDYEKVPDKLDITNNPRAFWEFVDKSRKGEIDMVK